MKASTLRAVFLVLLSGSFIFSTNKVKAQCNYELAMSNGSAPGTTITGVRATKSTSPFNTVNFTLVPGSTGRWQTPAVTGTWFIFVQVTGTYGSVVHQLSIPDCYPGGS